MTPTPEPRNSRKARNRAAPGPSARSARSPVGRSARMLTFVTGNPGKVAELRSLAEPMGWSVAQDKRGYPEVQADTLAEVCAAGAEHLLASGLRPPFLLEDSGL